MNSGDFAAGGTLAGVPRANPKALLALGIATAVAIRIPWLWRLDGLGHLIDSASYERVAWPNPARPLGALLWFGIVGDGRLAAIAHALVSIAAWTALTATVWRVLPARRWLSAAVFLLQFAPEFMGWDALLLSESISLTTLVAVVAAGLFFIGRPNSLSAGVLIASAAAASFVRESNPLLALTIALAVAVSLRTAGGPRRFARLGAFGSWRVGVPLMIGAVALVGLAGGAWVSSNPLPLAKVGPRNPVVAERINASNLRLMNIIAVDVARDPALRSRFQTAGMPPVPAGVSTEQIATLYEDDGLVRWVDTRGLSTWLAAVFADPVRSIKRVAAVDLDDRSDTAGGFDAVFSIPAISAHLPFATVREEWTLALATAVVFAGLVAARRRVAGADSGEFTAAEGDGSGGGGAEPGAIETGDAIERLCAVVVAGCWVHLGVSVNLDAIEHYRHNLGVWLLASITATIVAVRWLASVSLHRGSRHPHSPLDGGVGMPVTGD